MSFVWNGKLRQNINRKYLLKKIHPPKTGYFQYYFSLPQGYDGTEKWKQVDVSLLGVLEEKKKINDFFKK